MEKNSINSNAISDVFPSLKEFAVLFLFWPVNEPYCVMFIMELIFSSIFSFLDSTKPTLDDSLFKLYLTYLILDLGEALYTPTI